MSKTPLTSSRDGPPIDFWEDRLEIRAANLLAATGAPGFFENWIKRRSSAEISMLRALIGLPIDARRKGRVTELLQYADDLRCFIPVAMFGSRKSMLATLEVAEACVSDELLRLAAVGDSRHDTAALLFAIYDHSWEELEKVFFIDMLHRVGFARTKLKKIPRHPKRSLLDFLYSNDLKEVLGRFDKEQRDGRRCRMKGILEREGGLLVYVRRPHKEDHLLVDDQVVHGHDTDWIVLVFRKEGQLLNVASHGRNVAFAIAERIATAFYGRPCEYLNINEFTYPAQLKGFLERLAADEDPHLTMVAFRLNAPPLPALSDLEASNEANLSVGPGIVELQRLLGVNLLDGEHLERLSVVYKDKRVKLQIERSDEQRDERLGYVVRYEDHRLNLGQRREFEDLIERDYGFKIVSTEKCKIKVR